jgi:hypothetical protein
MDSKALPCSGCGFRGGDWCWPGDSSLGDLEACPLKDIRQEVEKLMGTIQRNQEVVQKRVLQDMTLSKSRTIIRLENP